MKAVNYHLCMMGLLMMIGCMLTNPYTGHARCWSGGFDKDCSIIPSNPGPGRTDDDKLAKFAWESFIALNWPASCNKGQPETGMLLGEEGNKPKPRVWEFYRAPEDVFLAQGKNPEEHKPILPWNCGDRDEQKSKSQRVRVEVKVGSKDIGKTLQRLRELRKTHPDTYIDAEGELKDGVDIQTLITANRIPLVDQHGYYILQDIRINNVEYNQIVKKKWYHAFILEQIIKTGDNPTTQEIESKKEITLPCSGNKADNTEGVPCDHYENEGAIELKIAWRILDKGVDQKTKNRYYTSKRTVQIPKEHSSTGAGFDAEVEAGLIGFHIMQKTSAKGWIWATFEHDDNTPPKPFNAEQWDQKYTLQDSTCQTDCNYNLPQTEYHFLWHSETQKAQIKLSPKSSNIAPRKANLPAGFNKALKEVNAAWKRKLGEVCEGRAECAWHHYSLVGLQWLGQPDSPYRLRSRKILPATSMTNTALEPFVQQSSCITCHSKAGLRRKEIYTTSTVENAADFSFLFERSSKPASQRQ